MAGFIIEEDVTMKYNAIKIVLLVMISIVFYTINVEAAEDSGYSVSPVLSEHQSQGVTSFFDIKWKPKQSDVFGIKITNNSNKEQTYKIELNKARTNKNGMIDYSNNQKEESRAQYKVTEMVEIASEVTVKANSDQTIKGTVTFGSENFNGILMGGVHVSEKVEKQQTSGVSNNVSYNIPFIIRGNIDKRPTPKIELTKVMIEKLSTEQYSVNTTLTNSGPNLLKEVKFQATIEDSNGKVIDRQESEIDITPDTTFIYPVKLMAKYKAGNYVVKLKLTHGKDNKWIFSKKITLSANDITNIQEIKSTETNNINGYIIGGSILILAAVSLFIWINKRKKHKKD